MDHKQYRIGSRLADEVATQTDKNKSMNLVSTGEMTANIGLSESIA